MTEFSQTQWADPGFAQEYREHADHYIPDRPYLCRLVRSFYRSFVARRPGAAVCDLGCGDGLLAQQLLQEDATIHVTLLDGSREMLEAARRRLGGHPAATFVPCAFEALLRREVDVGPFDFVVSAFAIHHLLQREKAALFEVLLERLNPGGCFLNVDTTLPSDPRAADWYYVLWGEWIAERERRSPGTTSFLDVPAKARANPDNKLSSLADQLEALSRAGFTQVECHYRNGLFTVYSGRKAGAAADHFSPPAAT